MTYIRKRITLEVDSKDFVVNLKTVKVKTITTEHWVGNYKNEISRLDCILSLLFSGNFYIFQEKELT